MTRAARPLANPPRPAAVAPRPAGGEGDGASPGRGASVARAYEQLRALIVRGRIAPGTRVVESDIAARLGVSRTPARSALHRLQQEGYVVAAGGAKEQRLVVAPLTQDDARELFHIVGQLEALAARCAAELPPAPRRALAGRMEALNAEFAHAVAAARPDPLRVFDLDAAFHRAYVEGAAGPRLLALHDAIKPQSERYARLYVSGLMDEMHTSVAEHAEIVRHIAAGDPLTSQQAVDTNWRNAALRLGTVIATFGERGSW